jgi:hypothetical protein
MNITKLGEPSESLATNVDLGECFTILNNVVPSSLFQDSSLLDENGDFINPAYNDYEYVPDAQYLVPGMNTDEYTIPIAVAHDTTTGTEQGINLGLTTSESSTVAYWSDDELTVVQDSCGTHVLKKTGAANEWDEDGKYWTDGISDFANTTLTQVKRHPKIHSKRLVLEVFIHNINDYVTGDHTFNAPVQGIIRSVAKVEGTNVSAIELRMLLKDIEEV